MRPPFALASIVAVLLVPSVAAAVSDPVDYQDAYPFSEGMDDVQTILSGTVGTQIAGEDATFGYFGTSGFIMNGIDRLCWDWESGRPECVQGDIWIEVADGGSLGYNFPGASSVHFTAEHGLAMFVDLSEEPSLNGMDLGPSLVASTVGGLVNEASVAPQDGTFATLTPSTSVRIYDGEVRRTVIDGKEGFTVEGAAGISAFSADGVVLPFGQGSTLETRPAGTELVREGLDPQRIATFLGGLRGATGSSDGAARLPDEVQSLLSEVLDGAVLRTRLGTDADFGQITLVRLDSATARSDGRQVLISGGAPLWITQGTVVGAPALVPGLGVPLWTLLLYGLGIALLVARIATGAPKTSEKWDKKRWIGWILTPVTLVVLFWFWDAEMAAVWGTSLLQTSADTGAARSTIAVLEIGSFLYMLAAAAYPLQMVLRNMSRLARQGTFMALDRPVSMVLGFLIGAPLLLSFIQLVMEQVIGRLA